MSHGQAPAVRSGYGAPTEAEYELALAGRARVITMLGSALPSLRVTPRQRAALKVAQAAGYLIVSDTRANVALDNAFAVWCYMHRRPFSVARVHGKYASVVVDFVEIPRNLEPSDALQAEANRFIDSFRLKPEWRARFRAHASIGPVYWNVAPIPVALAEEMVRGLTGLALRAVETAAKGGEA